MDNKGLFMLFNLSFIAWLLYNYDLVNDNETEDLFSYYNLLKRGVRIAIRTKVNER